MPCSKRQTRKEEYRLDSAKNKVRAEYSHRLITAYKVFTGEEPNPTEVQFLDVLARR